MGKTLLSVVVMVVGAGLFFSINPAKRTSHSTAVPAATAPAPAAQGGQLLADAHDACARAIAGHLGVNNWGAIPPVANASNGNEFYFAWPRGVIGLKTPLGDAPVSASCIGQLKPLAVQFVTVNGKDVL